MREKGVDLPDGYELEGAGDAVRVLKRPGGYALAAFGKGVDPEDVRRVAQADDEYLRLVEREERFGVAADPETAPMFAEDVKEARVKFLSALEAAYRE